MLLLSLLQNCCLVARLRSDGPSVAISTKTTTFTRAILFVTHSSQPCHIHTRKERDQNVYRVSRTTSKDQLQIGDLEIPERIQSDVYHNSAASKCPVYEVPGGTSLSTTLNVKLPGRGKPTKQQKVQPRILVAPQMNSCIPRHRLVRKKIIQSPSGSRLALELERPNRKTSPARKLNSSEPKVKSKRR